MSNERETAPADLREVNQTVRADRLPIDIWNVELPPRVEPGPTPDPRRSDRPRDWANVFFSKVRRFF